MSEPTIGIVGASGFTGSTLCERLYFENRTPFKAFIHSYANASRLARFPFCLTRVDLLDYEQVMRAFSGCDCIVNCSRGSDAVMTKGHQNLIRAAKKCGVSKFIHLSSIAIYGEDLLDASVSEDSAPKPSNQYGRVKKKQDDMMFNLHRRGVPSIILCPGTVVGPYSPFIVGAIQKLRAREVALVDSGVYPSIHIHVDNLVEAILAAVRADKGWGERYFVTEPDRPTWRQFFGYLKDMVDPGYELSSVSRSEVMEQISKASQPVPPPGLLRTLASGEFRKVLCRVPAFAELNEYARRTFETLDPKLQARIRSRLVARVTIPKESSLLNLSDRVITVQARRTYFPPTKIMQNLSYRPILTDAEAWESIKRWCQFAGLAPY